MRGVLPLLLLVCACQVAPAESPDEVVARENARVEAARKHAEEAERKEREAATRRQREEQEAHETAAAEDEARRRRATASKEASCASDRADRRRHIQEALDRAGKERARAAELEGYIAKNCTRKEIPDYETQQYVDERGYVRTRQVQSGKHDEIACPADAPPELRPGGAGVPTGVVQVQASAEERAKNDRCQDVQDLLKK